MVGAVPRRYHSFIEKEQPADVDLYFAMARGYQKEGYDLTAMEMTKWFDTNYHYIVPEFYADQKFNLLSDKAVREFAEAKKEGFDTKPVLLGPVSFLCLGKEKEEGFNRLDLIDQLLPVYLEVFKKLEERGAKYIQLDEPCLVLDLNDEERAKYTETYEKIKKAFPQIHFVLAGYFGCYGQNLKMVLNLPVQTIHLDLARCPEQLDEVLKNDFSQQDKNLSLGLVDGRNVWKNNYSHSLEVIEKAKKHLGEERVWIAPSCSLLHVPCDLDLETNEEALPAEIKNWLAFAKQKIEEVAILAELASA